MSTATVADLRREQRAFDRIVGFAAWARARREPFTFRDVCAAFPAAYEGTPLAIDRMWSRTKLSAAAIGAPLELVGAEQYLVADGANLRPLRLAASDAAAAAAEARALPLRGEPGASELLEYALRKLLLAGADILGVLWDRHLAALTRPRTGRAAIGGDALTRTERLVRVGALLHESVLAAGDGGLAYSEALVRSGARDEGEFEDALAALGDVAIPLPPPDDAIPMERIGGRVSAYAVSRPARRIALTRAELDSVRAAAGDGALARAAAAVAVEARTSDGARAA
jgi:hypothetical protein